MSLLFNETQQTPIVIAHRGASGYLPEHSLAAVAMAHAMDVDYIEQDVVLTSDGVPIVLHDVHIDTVTDVATVFPSRARSDGRYFAIDFTLDELKELKLCERIDFETGKAVYSRRFPVGKSSFRIPTLVEEIELIQGMNKSTGKSIGICVEIKSPAWHIEQGQHVSETTLSVLRSYGYCARADSAIIECFDATELRRIREQLECDLKLVQLIGENSWQEAPCDFDELKTEQGLQQIAEYADGIAPWVHQVLDKNKKDTATNANLVELAHKHRLPVYPYTFRADNLPDYAETFEELLELSIKAKVDGVFTDFPDRAVGYFKSRNVNEKL